jgi:hypothetical protein
MSMAERRENLMRMCNSASTLVTGFQNVRPKSRAEAKRMRREQNLLVNFLFNLHGVAEREDDMAEFIEATERVLAMAGFSFEDQDEAAA